MDKQGIQQRETNSVTKKVSVILFLTFILCIPLLMVENQISGRRVYESIAQEEVAKGWGKAVGLGSAKLLTKVNTIYPASSETVIEIDSQEKRRGLFSVPVYIAKLKSKVNFSNAIKQMQAPENIEKLNKDDYLSILVKPVASVQSFKVIDASTGKELNAKLTDEGITLLAKDLLSNSIFTHQLEIEISIRGTGSLYFESSSEQDKVQIVGNWKKPKFTEEVLPTYTKITSNGFEASWVLNNLPKLVQNSKETRVIGLELLWVGADYAKIERAAKYGVLLIALTFLLVFLVEYMSQARIHFLQYGLIGLSLSLFYLLLLAFSESLGFDVAYVISAVAVSGLIVFYVKGFLNSSKFVKMILAEQVLLSSFFYVLLSLEESAFLVGAIGLFAALAAFMAITRRFDWFTGKFMTAHENRVSS